MEGLLRIAVTGANGQVGRAIRAMSGAFGVALLEYPSDELDVSDARAVIETFARDRPSVIIHAGAITDTDGCEKPENRDRAYAVNALGTGYVAAVARALGCPMLYVSTNYVFDGGREEPYDEFDTPNPQSVYARSKYAGELAAARTGAHLLIVRTSMVYAEEGKNFLRTMLSLAERGTPLKVVGDQWGQPTYATDLAAGLLRLALDPVPGTYHLTNTGRASWADWAFAAWEMAGLSVEAERVPATAFPRACPPPMNGVLTNRAAAALGVVLPPWEDGLRRCLANMGRFAADVS